MMDIARLVTTLSLSMVVTTIAVIEFRNLKYSAYAYCLQALLMCSIFFVFAQNNPNLYVWLVVAFITKVCVIPYLLILYIKKTTIKEIKPPISYLPSILIACAIMIIFYNITHGNVDFIAPNKEATLEPFRTNLAVSFTIFALGLYCILIRRDAIKTVHGLCILENGVHLSLVSLTPGLAETALIGIVTDVVIAVFLLLYVILGIHKTFGSTDTYQLKNLRW
jgi:hydrogenase-4 component E